MRFVVRNRRTAPTVIIVALIDVLVVLVIFLVVTTTFKQHPLVKLALPTSSQARKPGASENPPTMVFVDSTGGLRLGNAAQPVTSDRLRDELQQLAQTNSSFAIALSADENAPWKAVLKVMDIAKELNIRSVNAFAKPTGDK